MPSLAKSASVDLRGHHLLCMLTYAGRGYSKAFERNFKRVMAWISARPHGAPIRIVAGTDALCRPLYRPGARRLKGEDSSGRYCFSAHAAERDRLALEDISAFLAARSVGEAALRPGSRLLLTASMIAELRAAYRGTAAGSAPRRACNLCRWNGFCSRTAAGDYKGTLLRDGASRRFSAC